MKKVFYFLFATLFLVSCREPEPKEDYNVILYYYGRSNLGMTYEVPIRFHSDGKEIAFFVLYSLSPDLENGVYNYNDSIYPSCQSFPDFAFIDKTFYKGVCKWKNNIITGGTVTVDRQGDNYTFIIDVTDYKGENHKATFTGKVKKENYHQQSKINGIFAAADIFNDKNHWSHVLPADYSGGVTWLNIHYGYVLYWNKVNIMYLHPNPNDFTGVYYINPNANGIYNPDSYIIQNLYEKGFGSENTYQLVSGTITVTRVDKPWSFKIDVDVVASDGNLIQGTFGDGEVIQDSFDGGQIWFFGYDYPNYSGKNYADYYYSTYW